MTNVSITAGPRISELQERENRKTVGRRIPVLGLFFLFLFMFMVIFGSWVAPFDYEYWDMGSASLPPVWMEDGSSEYILGTDSLGRDVLSRIIHGARFSLAIAVACIAAYGSIGTILGLLSGFLGGKVDFTIMRLCDLWMGMPNIILAILIVSILGPSAQTIVIVVGITGWPAYARIIRGECMSLAQNDYIDLARVAGCSHTRIMFTHILPNLANTLIVLVTLNIGQIIILTATMSFLGLGTQPPSPDWGLMMSEGRQYIDEAWWLVVFPGVAILIAVLGFNLVGDWLREVLDPKQKLR